MKARIDTILSDAVQRGDVPGVAAVVTDANGTSYEGGFGKAILGQDADMTPDTVVWLASMTKAVTGAVAMQQVERGALKLDAPARNVIPYLGEVQVLEGFDTAGKPRLRRPKRRHHATPSPHPHGGLRLRHLERRDPASIREGHGRADHRHWPRQGTDDTLVVRSSARAGNTASASIGPARWSRP